MGITLRPSTLLLNLIFRSSENSASNNQQSRLLWIKSVSDKGNTMLLCGVVNELKKLTAETYLPFTSFAKARTFYYQHSVGLLIGRFDFDVCIV